MSWTMLLFQCPPDQEGTEEIEQRLDTIGNEGIGAADDTSRDLPRGEEQVQDHSGQDHTAPLGGSNLEITVGHWGADGKTSEGLKG